MTNEDRKFALDVFDRVLLLIPAVAAFWVAVHANNKADKTKAVVKDNIARLNSLENGGTQRKIAQAISAFALDPVAFLKAARDLDEGTSTDESKIGVGKNQSVVVPQDGGGSTEDGGGTGNETGHDE